MKLRLLKPNDSATILAWRNDPLVRRMSFNQREVSQADHDKYISSCLEQDPLRVWIIDIDGTAVGWIRENVHNQEVAWLLGAEHRGHGYMLKAVNLFNAHREYYKVLIKSENTASLRTALKAGLEVVEEGEEVTILEWHNSVLSRSAEL